MAKTKSRLTRHYRRRWAAMMATVVVIEAASFVCLYLVRYDGLARTPWKYVAVTAAILAAMAGMVMTFVEGKIETDLTGRRSRTRLASKLQRHHRQ